MARLKLFWDPAGLELNAIGTNRFVRITDGDTPLCLDGHPDAEYRYAGSTLPGKSGSLKTR
jgi:hypothetical protein